jgi:hypothetical protein
LLENSGSASMVCPLYDTATPPPASIFYWKSELGLCMHGGPGPRGDRVLFIWYKAPE